QPPPVALSELAQRVRLRKVTWREGSKGKLSGRFDWLRVWPGQGWQEGSCIGAGPVGLLIPGNGSHPFPGGRLEVSGPSPGYLEQGGGAGASRVTARLARPSIL